MNESFDSDQRVQVINPYRAPKDPASLRGSRILSYSIVGVVILGFVIVGVFAYSQFSRGFIYRAPPPPDSPAMVNAADLVKPLSEILPPGGTRPEGIPIRAATDSSSIRNNQEVDPQSPTTQR